MDDNSILELLQKTADSDHAAMGILHADGRELVRLIIDNTNLRPSDGAFISIMYGMGDYIENSQSPTKYRQCLWDVCNAWIKRIADEMSVDTNTFPAFEEKVPKPAVVDPGIELLKALHAEGGQTKKSLSDMLGVSQKTIQTNLRALCPDLQEGGEAPKPLRLGGQILRADIKYRTDADTGERFYSTQERVHPIVLQLNTMQVGHVMMSLQQAFIEDDDDICQETALDIWSQISKAGKARIRDVYCTRNKDLESFLDELDVIEHDSENGRPIRFHTEAEMQDWMTPELLLESAFKGGSSASLTIEQNGSRTRLKHVRIRWSESRRDEWLAIPEDEYPDNKNAIRFLTDEVASIIIIHNG